MEAAAVVVVAAAPVAGTVTLVVGEKPLEIPHSFAVVDKRLQKKTN